MCRGNLNCSYNLLKLIIKISFNFCLEYSLEYRQAGFELRILWRS